MSVGTAGNSRKSWNDVHCGRRRSLFGWRHWNVKEKEQTGVGDSSG